MKDKNKLIEFECGGVDYDPITQTPKYAYHTHESVKVAPIDMKCVNLTHNYLKNN